MADNASITILRNTKANIDAEPIKDGNILFTTDQANNKIYADVGTKRIKIGGDIDVDTELSPTSTNPVQNKVVTNSIDDVRGQIHTNLLNPTLQKQTVNGVTCANNGDGTYTVNGTATETIWFTLTFFDDISILENKKLVGCPVGGTSSTYIMYITCYNDSTSKDYIDYGNGVILSNIPSEENSSRLYILIRKGVTVNNLLFKPMLTADLNATYNDYVPYSGDGRLNENVAGLFDMFHPIGSLYPTTNASFDPNTAKGWHGTWERITDCVIYAAGTSDTVGQIVGSNTHTLTEAELPSHTHSIPQLSGNLNNNQVNIQYGDGHGSFKTISPSVANLEATYGGSFAAASLQSTGLTTNASTTGSKGSGTAIDMRTRRLNSVVWRRTA
jgi:hypothetical protein